MPNSQTPKVFISYSHKDEKWKDRLQSHLNVLQRNGLLSVWEDRQITVGQDWYPAIEKNLNEAAVAIFLISVHFLGSDFILREEIPRLLERRKQQGMQVIPLILTPCPWQAISWLNAIQGATRDNIALSGISKHKQEDALSRLALTVNNLLNAVPLTLEPVSVPLTQPEQFQALVQTTEPPVIVSNSVMPVNKPTWASKFGNDNYGTFADLNVQGIVQRFRWIKSGTFLMGSPESELGRLNETQHKVTLTQGFWLADTAVTQELWQIIVEGNPSTFKNNRNNPVECVSLHDTRYFIENLNLHIPNLLAQLPTEAQWEYACRAGTTTPFSFGQNITPQQVNYNGNFPYVNNQHGLYREETVAVKSLPPNSWGLYEMHGNVWEWCSDVWQSEISSDSVVDPSYSNNSPDDCYAVRGGSYSLVGSMVQSSVRAGKTPNKRGCGLGFRLALNHQSGQ